MLDGSLSSRSRRPSRSRISAAPSQVILPRPKPERYPGYQVLRFSSHFIAIAWPSWLESRPRSFLKLSLPNLPCIHMFRFSSSSPFSSSPATCSRAPAVGSSRMISPNDRPVVRRTGGAARRTGRGASSRLGGAEAVRTGRSGASALDSSFDTTRACILVKCLCSKLLSSKLSSLFLSSVYLAMSAISFSMSFSSISASPMVASCWARARLATCSRR
mmetsp:Transcript_23041/g.74144  ORF Transcript_23041/g.74144 Transcript_23041/m.74144 type:complete len:217 (-) Transcript_23041:1187-1837(-)